MRTDTLDLAGTLGPVLVANRRRTRGGSSAAPEAVDRMGDKINACDLMKEAGMPVAAGTREPVTDLDLALRAAREVGCPVMVTTAGGGGRA